MRVLLTYLAKPIEMEVPDAEGADLCARGMAQPVAVFRETETATAKSAPERRAPRSKKE